MTSQDVGQWLTAHAAARHAVGDRLSFRRMCDIELRELVEHQALLAVIGKVVNDRVSILSAISCGVPDALVSEAMGGSDLADRPLVRLWLQRREPLFIDEAFALEHASASERGEIARYGLGCLAIHGVVDTSGSSGSYFSFSGVSPSRAADTVRRLELVVPHLHVALLRVWRAECAAWAHRMTPRERDLLQCLSAGMSNPEIAFKSGRSQATIRNQLHHLMGKLEVGSRLELVARAAELGLLDQGLRGGLRAGG